MRSRVPSPKSLWRNRDFMLLWSGQLVSSTGSGMSGLVFPLLILAITGSPAQAGIGGFLFSMPYLILSLPAGALIDRWDRKRVMIICDSFRAINAASIPLAAWLWHLTVGQLYITAIVEGTGYVFFNIAEVACLPRVVDKEQLPEATGQNQAGLIAASVVSPPLGGFLFQSVGRTVPFVADALSYAVSVISLSFIQVRFQEERTVARRRLWTEIVEGVSWLWNQPLFRYMSFLTGGVNFVYSASFLVIVILAKQEHASAGVIGILFAIQSVGGVLGSVVAPRIQKRFTYAQVIIAMVWLETAFMPLYAIAPNPIVLGAIGAGQSLTIPIYNVVQFSYRVASIPDELQGRVNSVVRLIAFGFNPLGAILSGFLLQWIGAVTTVLLLSAWLIGLSISVSVNRHVRSAKPLTEIATSV